MAERNLSRRRFLNLLWAGLGTVALVELFAVVTAWFRPRPPRTTGRSEDPVVVAGAVSDFEPGSVTAFVRGKFYLARLENGGFLALSRSCTHLGCTVPWVADEQRFVCPCHASAFALNGEVLEPPAPRALDLFEVRIVNDVVQVDTGRRSKRAAFDPEQATYPERA